MIGLLSGFVQKVRTDSNRRQQTSQNERTVWRARMTLVFTIGDVMMLPET